MKREEAAWAAIGSLYARPGVAKAAIRLQDEYGADVVLLLYAVWVGQLGSAISEPLAARLDAATERWREEVVKPVRRARRGAVSTRPDLAARMQALEFEAELAQLDLLCGCDWPSEPGSIDGDLASANLIMCLPPAARGSATALQLAKLLCA